MLGLATAVSSDPSPPNLISISYGGTESFYTKYIGPTYIPRCNVEFQKVAGRAHYVDTVLALTLPVVVGPYPPYRCVHGE